MGIIENEKEIAKTIQQIDNIDLYRQILDLQGEINDLVTENIRLEEGVRGLEKAAKIREELHAAEQAYWRATPDGPDGPFCTNCWDVRELLVRMHFMGNKGYSQCPTCQLTIEVDRTRARQEVSSRTRK